ncbi:hypothetical protein GCK72_020838 [Caenorhabditis remanei]|uniref:Uncharacterized protein n=1 Tax=Caenorhabditis remanei TaxID=31234 RepID=A0A6A5GGD6_CAERE|nr:hypothetical protein GCK72_020838 [Caenorhabditis remanei]KAF1754278.1 hypothetical protein GCK72_020838 [Caenorhabditis remanei]
MTEKSVLSILFDKGLNVDERMAWKEHVESLVHRIQDNYTHVGNSAKADILEPKKVISDAITIFNDGLNIGKLNFKDIADKLGIIAGWGSVIKDLANILLPGKKDPVMEKLRELGNKMDQLSNQMTKEFDALKAFIVEHNFFADVAQTAATLSKFMRDTVTSPCRDSYEIFKEAARKTPPLEYAYKMISLLEQDSTNPLKMAMDVEEFGGKRSTFDNWRNTIDAVITQFLLLETYINGMFWDKNMYGPNELKNKIEKLNRNMDQWREDYKKSYWKKITPEFIKAFQIEHVKQNNEEKATILQNELGQVLTDDAFYIMVYDHCSGYDKHSFQYRTDQYVSSFRIEGCCVVIYRSRCWNSSDTQSKKQIEIDVESCRNNTIGLNADHEKVPQWLRNNRIRDCHFVGLIKSDLMLSIKSANTPGYQWGPGWWIKVVKRSGYECLGSSAPELSYYLIAGFK